MTCPREKGFSPWAAYSTGPKEAKESQELLKKAVRETGNKREILGESLCVFMV
jgi:hypothetical protein